MIKVKNLNGVKNQFVFDVDGKTYFQSYETIIACINNGKVVLDTNALNYSRTTSKYLYRFLEGVIPYDYLNKMDIQKLIDAGKIETTNLN